MSYSMWLSWLLATGPKLPKVFEHVTKGTEEFRQAAILLSGAISESVYVPTGEELALEGQIAQALTTNGSQAAFDGSRLRGIFKFLNDSGLLQILIQVLTKTSPSA